MIEPFAIESYLCVPYRPFVGNAAKNELILARCEAYPERFLASPRSGNPRMLVAAMLTDPDNLAWEVWQSGGLCGIILLDRIVPSIDARMHCVFFDDELVSKVTLVRGFMARCVTELLFERLTLEVPAHMTTLTGFARRKLGFVEEGRRLRAYHDGLAWHDLVTLGILREALS